MVRLGKQMPSEGLSDGILTFFLRFSTKRRLPLKLVAHRHQKGASACKIGQYAFACAAVFAVAQAIIITRYVFVLVFRVERAVITLRCRIIARVERVNITPVEQIFDFGAENKVFLWFVSGVKIKNQRLTGKGFSLLDGAFAQLSNIAGISPLVPSI